ncbi:hypothetical protein [Rhodococcus sp. 06-156-3C]|uniref:hypothetical protein n=1 Tax=Rhodococcus sp. 06-156-3C TaxID=2022486 RepID=UPI00159524E8|nr:hypothetical protein [Rhodococcus sp. 06-156-3C]
MAGLLAWAALGAVRAVRTARAQKREVHTASATQDRPAAPPSWQKYGHPIFPLIEIRKGLHKPPPGHFWELGRVINDEGESFATLRLVEYASSKAVDEKSQSLDNQKSGKSWAEVYEDDPYDHIRYFSGSVYGGGSDAAQEEARRAVKARRLLVRPFHEWSRIAYVKASSEPGAMVDVEVIA